MSSTFEVQVVSVRELSASEAAEAAVARGSGARSARRIVERAAPSERFVECTLEITPAHADVVWAPRACVELVTRLMAERNDRAAEQLFVSIHSDLWDRELVIPWPDAVLAYTFLERSKERSCLVVTLAERFARQITVGERWGSIASAEVCDSIFEVFPPPDGLASMRRAHTMKPLTEAEAYVEISEIAFSPDGTRLATVDNTGTVVIHDVEDGTRLHVLGAGEWGPSRIAFTPDGRFVARGSASGKDGGLTLWPAGGGPEPRRELPSSATLFRLAYTADGSRLFATTPDRVVALDARTLEPLGELERLVDDPDERDMGPLILTRAGDRGAASGESESGAVIEAFTTDPLASAWRADVPGVPLALAFTRNEREIVVALHDAIDVLDAATGALARRFLDEPEGSTFALAFSDDGRYLATGHPAGFAVWDYARGVRVRFEYVSEDTPEVYQLGVSKDGRFFAAATARTVTLFDLGSL